MPAVYPPQSSYYDMAHTRQQSNYDDRVAVTPDLDFPESDNAQLMKTRLLLDQ